MIQNPNPVTDNDSSSIMQGQYKVDLVAVAFIGRPCQRVRDTSALKENQTKQNKTIHSFLLENVVLNLLMLKMVKIFLLHNFLGNNLASNIHKKKFFCMSASNISCQL